MKRLFQILGILVLVGALPACRDAGGADNVAPTPSPTPVPTPTPTPVPDSSIDDSEDPSTIDDGGTPAVSDSGTAMVSSSETITVISGSPLDATTSEIAVQRANGEVWTFDVLGAPAPAAGDEALFEAASLVFGDANGFLLFPSLNSARYGIADAARIR